MENVVRIKNVTMQNLPMSQDRVNLDVLANDVFLDLRSLGDNVELHEIFETIKVLHTQQDLFIFSDGTVAATRKGIKSYG